MAIRPSQFTALAVVVCAWLVLVAPTTASDAGQEAGSGGGDAGGGAATCPDMDSAVNVVVTLANRLASNIPTEAVKKADSIAKSLPVLEPLLDGKPWESFVAPKLSKVIIAAVNPAAATDDAITGKLDCILAKIVAGFRSPGAAGAGGDAVKIPETAEEAGEGGLLSAVGDAAGAAADVVISEAVEAAVSGLNTAMDNFPSDVVAQADGLVSGDAAVKAALKGKTWEEAIAAPISFVLLMAFPDLAKDPKALKTLADKLVVLVQKFREAGGAGGGAGAGAAPGAVVEAAGDGDIKESKAAKAQAAELDELHSVASKLKALQAVAGASSPAVGPALARLRSKLRVAEAELVSSESSRFIACFGTKVPPESGKIVDETFKCTRVGNIAEVIKNVRDDSPDVAYPNHLRVIQSGKKIAVPDGDKAADGQMGIKILEFKDDGTLNDPTPTGVKEATPMSDTPVLKVDAAIKYLQGLSAAAGPAVAAPVAAPAPPPAPAVADPAQQAAKTALDEAIREIDNLN